MAGNEKVGNGVVDSSDKDDRIPCKYGPKCYQKNPIHRQKYKHPLKRKVEAEEKRLKKPKLVPNERKEKEVPFLANKHMPVSKEKPPVLKEEENQVLCVPDEDDLPSSPENEKESIKQKFLVEMPDDFYSFWSFCKSKSPDKPEEALRDVGLLLVGPFDVLSGKLKKTKHRKLSLYLVHWRYYFDPPEFQTIIKGDDKKQYHIGYFRDDPHESPCFVASNSAAVDCTITPMAENIFGAVNAYLEAMKIKSDPFQKMKIAKLQTSLQLWSKENSFHIGVTGETMKKRKSKIVTKTFHNAGIVVPVDKTTDLGYRELIETDANLKKILKNVVESSCEVERDVHLGKLQPIVTAANIANDECDFGTSLELGLDLFCFGGKVLQRTALDLLKNSYTLLQRNEFALIAKAHLKNRRKGAVLSIVEEST